MGEAWTPDLQIQSSASHASTNRYIRELKIPRQRRLQKRRLKSDFAIYETLVPLSLLGHYVLCRQTLLELNS